MNSNDCIDKKFKSETAIEEMQEAVTGKCNLCQNFDKCWKNDQEREEKIQEIKKISEKFEQCKGNEVKKSDEIRILRESLQEKETIINDKNEVIRKLV